MQPEPDTQVIPPRDGRVDPPEQARPPADSGPLILQRWVGRYELIHRLAHGGMATVYLGRAKGKAGFEKIVAVKVIHPHLANEAEFVGMFLDEARIAARIHHPHVVEILDLGESDGVYYMVMEFIEGENLAALVRALKGEKLPVHVVLQLIADTLEGLCAAHDLRDANGAPYKLVHRDVSPHNILINLDGWAKVGDFGIMKAAGKASNTKTGELRGKLAYMSPEQARGGGQVDHRTDLFAVGVIAWELLTGRRLFACPTEAATLEKVIACEVPTLASVEDARPELSEHEPLRDALEAFLARALSPDPERRQANAEQMLAEVKRLTRLADDAVAVDGHDARAYLGKQMRRFFERRVDYARAALRRTGEHDALVASSREWSAEPTLQVARPSTGSNPAVEASVPALERPVTGSNPGVPGSASHPQLSGTHAAPASQWWLWLVLPMLGAGIAVAAMWAIGPRLGAPADDAQAIEAPQPPPAQESETPRDNRRAPSELAAKDYKPIPDKPPGTIRWWFSTSPSGAQLFIAGEPHGRTPTFVHVPTAEEPVEIRIELEGYEPHVLQLPPANDQSFAPQLRPLDTSEAPAPAGKPSSKRKRKSDKPATKTEPSSEDAATKKAFLPVPESLREP